MSRDTWRVRDTGTRWIVPRRDDLPFSQVEGTSLYLTQLDLVDTSSEFNCGPLNSFLIGDTELCSEAAAPLGPTDFDVVQMTTVVDYLKRTLTMPSSTTRAYGSLWVTLPISDLDAAMVIGISVDDATPNRQFVLFGGYDVFGPAKFRHELNVNVAGGSPARQPEVEENPVGDAVNPRWFHILFEVDTSETVAADRTKLWFGDTKVTVPNQHSTLGLNEVIVLGTGPHEVQFSSQSSPAFGAVDATCRIAGAWVKFSTTTLFDFEVAADRRNFIGAAKEYVAHTEIMGGQTADFWGAGNLAGWAGWTNNGGTSETELSAPVSI